MIKFTARIEIVGVNPYLTVPAAVSRHFGQRGNVPVLVQLKRGQIPSTLVPVGGGVHRLYINRAMLRCTDARVGDWLALGLRRDANDRALKAPAGLINALRTQSAAAARWRSLAPSKRQEVIRYLLSGKTPATRERNLAKLLSVLTSERVGVLCGIEIRTVQAIRTPSVQGRRAAARRQPGTRVEEGAEADC